MKAIQIDETLAEAHGALAFVLHVYYWDWAGAEREDRRAIELNPSYADGHYDYALCLSQVGRHLRFQQAHRQRPQQAFHRLAVGIAWQQLGASGETLLHLVVALHSGARAPLCRAAAWARA